MTRNGKTIDLSTPFVRDDEESKPSAAFTADEDMQGVGAFARASLKAASMEAVEVASLATWAADVVSGKGTPESLANVQDKLASWESAMKESQAAYVAAGWDPEANVYDVPGLGPVTIGEFSRALGTSAAYTVGLSFGAMKLWKLARFGTKAVKLARKTGDIGDASRRVASALDVWPQLVKEKKALGAEIKTLKKADPAGLTPAQTRLINDGIEGSEAILRLDEIVRTRGAAFKEVEKIIHLVEPVKPWQQMTWGMRFRQLRDLYGALATDKYHPLIALVRRAAPSEEKHVARMINQLRAAAHVDNAPLTTGVPRWFKNKDGVDTMIHSNEALQDIFQGVHGDQLFLETAYGAVERLLEDISPRWDELVGKLGLEGAVAAAKTERVPMVLNKQRVQANKIKLMITDIFPQGRGRGRSLQGYAEQIDPHA